MVGGALAASPRMSSGIEAWILPVSVVCDLLVLLPVLGAVLRTTDACILHVGVVCQSIMLHSVVSATVLTELGC